MVKYHSLWYYQELKLHFQVFNISTLHILGVDILEICYLGTLSEGCFHNNTANTSFEPLNKCSLKSCIRNQIHNMPIETMLAVWYHIIFEQTETGGRREKNWKHETPSHKTQKQ